MFQPHPKTPRLLALAASYRQDSYNQHLLRLATQHAKSAGASITTLFYNEVESPLFKDMDTPAPLPSGAARLRDALIAHDGLLLSTPEYNWSIPASLKNLIDWISTDAQGAFDGRTAFLMCASPSSRGGIMGLSQLRVPLEHLGMIVYPQVIGLGHCAELLTPQGIARAKEAEYLAQHVTGFVTMTRALCS
jgi:chromate reductase, NAD(P)H dehydrogenase (quinone)